MCVSWFSIIVYHGSNDSLTEQTRTNMSSMVWNCSRVVYKYIRHLNSFDISDNSDSSDSRQEQTCLQQFATVWISNRQYLGLGGPGVCAVSALFIGLSSTAISRAGCYRLYWLSSNKPNAQKDVQVHASRTK